MSLPHETIVSLLDGLDFFSSLSSEDVAALARRTETITWPAGTIVFHEGAQGDACYVLERGRVTLTRRLNEAQPSALAHVGRGGVVGELALFAGDRRSATMEAVEDTTAIAIRGDDLMAILHSDA